MTIGQTYTREEISRTLGGDLQSYRPQCGKRIVCGCFRSDKNPLAPSIVLVGSRPIVYRKAQTLCEQGGSLPVFIRQVSNAWKYVGDFTVSRCTEAPEEIMKYEQSSGRRGLRRIVFLDLVDR